MEGENEPLKIDVSNFPSIWDIDELMENGAISYKQHITLDYLSDENKYNVSKILFTPLELFKIDNMRQVIRSIDGNLTQEEVCQTLRLGVEAIATDMANFFNMFGRSQKDIKKGIGEISTMDMLMYSAQIDDKLYNRIGIINSAKNN